MNVTTISIWPNFGYLMLNKWPCQLWNLSIWICGKSIRTPWLKLSLTKLWSYVGARLTKSLPRFSLCKRLSIRKLKLINLKQSSGVSLGCGSPSRKTSNNKSLTQRNTPEISRKRLTLKFRLKKDWPWPKFESWTTNLSSLLSRHLKFSN
jgi:hypothetical protein